MSDLSELAPALVAAVAEMNDLPRTRTAKVDTKTGGSYSYTYADLGDALGYIRPILAAHGLTVIQDAHGIDGRVGVTTIIIHRSGQTLRTDLLELPAGNTPQAAGSAITYARRYQLLAALGLATDDDDGAAASRAPKAKPARKTSAVDGPSQAQTKKAMAMFGEAGITERDKRLAFTSTVLDRVVESWNEVTADEARQVIDRLAKIVEPFEESP